jgi:hypothetical protein
MTHTKAIASLVRATAIYSDDNDIRTIATAEDVSVIGLADFPDENLQGEFVFEPRDPTDVDDAGAAKA